MGLLGLRGIFLRSSQTLVELFDVNVIAFDKTGTLTASQGTLDTSGLHVSPSEWMLVKALAAQSVHPVSRGIAATKPVATQLPVADAAQEFPGQGIRGMVDGVPVLIGTTAFVGANGALAEGTHISVDGRYAGCVRHSPLLRPGLDRLANSGHLVLISGDSKHDAEKFTDLLGTNMWFEQRPDDKVQRITELQRERGRVLMVGDGLDDAAALQAANVSIAVTDNTSTLAPASDVVMNSGNVINIPTVLRYAHTMRTVVWVSVVFTVLYNALGLSLAISGVLTPVMTAVLMPLSSLVVIAISVGGAHFHFRRQSWV
jgi:Cu+-exporting ATPase